MKRSIILGAVSAMAMIASAQAANLSAPVAAEPAYVPPPYTWSGFYIGVNGGYGWNSGGVTVIHTEPYYPSSSSWMEANGINHNFDGGFGGGQIGFNVQRDRMVFGLEADFQGSGLSSSATIRPDNWYGYATASSQLDWFATIRGPLGLVAYNNWLIYMTGGAAFGGVQDSLHQDFDWGLYSTRGLASTKYWGAATATHSWGTCWAPAWNTASRPPGRSSSNINTWTWVSRA